MSNATADPCTVRIDGAGLPNRGPLVLDRERSLAPMMVMRLENRPKASPDGALRRLTVDLLRTGFTERAATRLPAAGFLAGRCEPPSGEGATPPAQFATWLTDVTSSLDVQKLAAMAPSFVECAMSIGLRGDVESATSLLRSVTAGAGVGSSYDWLAASYLAQYGDPSGWSAMRRVLGGGDEHLRLMATRQLFAFNAFDGETVDGSTIDVRAALLERLDDEAAYVGVEVPGLIAEAGIADAADLLRDAAHSASHAEVRGAAADVLQLVEPADE